SRAWVHRRGHRSAPDPVAVARVATPVAGQADVVARRPQARPNPGLVSTADQTQNRPFRNEIGRFASARAISGARGSYSINDWVPRTIARARRSASSVSGAAV